MAHLAKVFFACLFRLIGNKNWGRRNIKYFLSYCRYAMKYIVYWKLLKIPLHSETILKYKLHFFHYSIFLSLFEDMFLNDEYYVKLPRNPHIIDLGSEIGLSVTYFKSMYPNARIMAFEPDPASYELLTKNIRNNIMKKVTTYNVAPANKVGLMSFYIDPSVEGSLTMSLFEKRQKKRIAVKVDRLSHYIKQRVDLLKMDIEGAEFDVLSDLSHSKKISLIDSMMMEYHHHIDTKKITYHAFLPFWKRMVLDISLKQNILSHLRNKHIKIVLSSPTENNTCDPLSFLCIVIVYEKKTYCLV